MLWPIILPVTPGQDLIGRIVYVGDKVKEYTNYKQGDRVGSIGRFLGGNARYVSLPAKQLVRVPDTVDAAEAACIPRSYLAAYQILYRTGAFELDNKHRILITGANGAVGRALIELSKMARARVYAASSTRHKRLVQSIMGVTWVHSDPQNWTRLHDIDIVIDCVNFTGNFNDSKTPLARGGVLVCVGNAKYVSDAIREQRLQIQELDYAYDSDEEQPYLDAVGGGMCGVFECGEKKKAVYQSNMLSHMPLKCGGGIELSFFITKVSFDLFSNLEKDWDACKGDLEYLFAMLLRGRIKPIVKERMPLTQVAKGHKMLESRSIAAGTLVCMPYMAKPSSS